MKDIAQKLEAEMAKAVSLIIAASHAAAVESLDEAFGVARHIGNRSSEKGQRLRTKSRVPPSERRTGAEITALEERFLDAVRATPGESMSVLASRVGAQPNHLQVPVARLKSSGRLRTVGSRQFTRYFPGEQRDQGDNEIGG